MDLAIKFCDDINAEMEKKLWELMLLVLGEDGEELKDISDIHQKIQQLLANCEQIQGLNVNEEKIKSKLFFQLLNEYKLLQGNKNSNDIRRSALRRSQ